MHALGHFEMGDLRFQRRNEIGFAGRMSGLGDDDCRYRFAEVRIRHADDRRLGDARQRIDSPSISFG